MEVKVKHISNKQIYNRITKWFFKENNVPALEGTKCVYWGMDGMKRCAIGCVVPKTVAKHLEEKFPGKSINNAALWEYLVGEGIFDWDQHNYVRRMQQIHDHHATPTGFSPGFKEAIDNIAQYAGVIK